MSSSPDSERIEALQNQLNTAGERRKAELEAEIKKLSAPAKKAPETATAQPKAERAVKPAAKRRTKR